MSGWFVGWLGVEAFSRTVSVLITLTVSVPYLCDHLETMLLLSSFFSQDACPLLVLYSVMMHGRSLAFGVQKQVEWNAMWFNDSVLSQF